MAGAYLLLFLGLMLGYSHGAVIDQFANPFRLTGSSFGISGRNATYDYIVVGAGIAGSVAAARLAENNASVALIEAGSFYELTNGNLSQIPFWSEEGIGDEWSPAVDWGLVTTPQINGKQYHYAQGRALGGSSARNQMMYHWPTKDSMRAWAEQVDDDSYEWEHMVKYLRRSARFTPNSHRRSDDAVTSDLPAGGGPLQVTLPSYINPLSMYGAEAFSSIGLQNRPSLTSGDLQGFGWWHFTMDPATGIRSSAESSFLAKALRQDDSKLTIYLGTQARRILSEGKKAIGVLAATSHDSRPFQLSARKEVLIAAGAYHSPQLLMVSGIGDRDVLEPLGIPLVSNLPGVGQNMRDSCYLAGPVYEVAVPGPSHWRDSGRMANATEQFLSDASGPLTNIGVDLAVWDVLPDESRANLSQKSRDMLSKMPQDWPLVEYSLSSTNRVSRSVDLEKHYGTIDCVLVATNSRGNMTINSASNLDPPIISPNWLRDELDQEIAVQAYRRARKAWEAIPDDVRLGEELFPGVNVTTDAELLEAIKAVLSPIHHVSSSCAMGKANDHQAVVDSDGRVFGVRGLRVIDSSAFPFTPPGHTQATTYALAEKLIEGVLNDNAKPAEDESQIQSDLSPGVLHSDL